MSVTPEMKRGRGRLAAIVAVGHGIKHLYNSGLRSLLLPEMKIDLHLSGARFGLLATAQQATSWGTTMGAGYLGDRFSNRAPLMLGLSLGLIGVAFLLVGLAPAYGLVLAAMLLAGIGPSLYHPPALGELSRRFPDRRGFAISLHGTGGIAGEVVGPLVAAGALALLSWRGVMQASAFPAVLAGVLIWGSMRTVGARQASVASARAYFLSLRGVLASPGVLLLVLVTGLRSIGENAVTAFLPVYLREDLAFPEYRVAAYLSLAQVAGLGAQPALGLLSDRVGRKAVLVPGLAVAGLVSGALAVAGKGVGLAAVVVARGAFSFSLHHIFIAAAIDASRGHLQSTVVALIYGAGFLGVFSPYVAGLLVDRYGIHSAFLYGGAVALLAAVTLAALMAPAPPSPAVEEEAH